jgi:hypothetical protein
MTGEFYCSHHVVGMICGAVCMWRSLIGIKFSYLDMILLSLGVVLLFI